MRCLNFPTVKVYEKLLYILENRSSTLPRALSERLTTAAVGAQLRALVGKTDLTMEQNEIQLRRDSVAVRTEPTRNVQKALHVF